jgi:hypothetical protein
MGGSGHGVLPGAGRMTRVAIPYPTRTDMTTYAPSRGRQTGRTAAERLATSYVIEPNGCWRWSKSVTTQGYGHVSIAGIQYQAHRLLYILRFGRDVPAGLFPDHLCRNRWCVNPDHLEPVTHAVNVQRGTQAHLTPEQVDAIRLACRTRSQRVVAREYGIDHGTVSRLVRGLTWADRPFPVETVAA